MIRGNKLWILMLLFLIFGLVMRVYLYNLLPTHLTPDSDYYHQLAVNLIRGKGFSLKEASGYRLVYEQTPGYSLFLAMIYRMLPGSDVLANDSIKVLTVIWLQHLLTLAVAGGWAAIFYFWTKSTKMSLIYWIISVVYLPYSIAANYLLSEIWGLCLLTLVVGGWTIALIKKNPRWNLLSGMLIGILVLVRPAMIILWPAYGWWLIFMGKNKISRRGHYFGWLSLALIIPISVWIIRTGVVTKHWVPIQVGVSRVLVSGGCPEALCGLDYRKVPLPVASIFLPSTGPTTKPNLAYLWWWYQVKKVRDLLSRPFGFYDLQAAVGINQLLARVMFLFQLGLLTFMGIGGITALRRKQVLSLTVIVLITGVIAHSLLWSEPRYGLMFMPFLLALSVEGLRKIWTSRDLWVKAFKQNLEKIILTTLGFLSLGIIFMLPEFVGWGWIRTLASGIFWLGLLVMILIFSLRRARYTLSQKVTAIVFALMLWGLAIGVWQPVRAVMFPQWPNNDYVFPVGVWFNGQQWL